MLGHNTGLPPPKKAPESQQPPANQTTMETNHMRINNKYEPVYDTIKQLERERYITKDFANKLLDAITPKLLQEDPIDDLDKLKTIKQLKEDNAIEEIYFDSLSKAVFTAYITGIKPTDPINTPTRLTANQLAQPTKPMQKRFKQGELKQLIEKAVSLGNGDFKKILAYISTRSDYSSKEIYNSVYSSLNKLVADGSIKRADNGLLFIK